MLAITTGMRQGELIGLQWKDVDLDGGTLRVNRSVYEGVVSPPKTNAGKRAIRLSKLAVAALRQHRINTAKRRIGEWVFPNANGTPVGRRNLHNRSWKPLSYATLDSPTPLGSTTYDIAASRSCWQKACQSKGYPRWQAMRIYP